MTKSTELLSTGYDYLKPPSRSFIGFYGSGILGARFRVRACRFVFMVIGLSFVIADLLCFHLYLQCSQCCASSTGHIRIQCPTVGRAQVSRISRRCSYSACFLRVRITAPPSPVLHGSFRRPRGLPVRMSMREVRCGAAARATSRRQHGGSHAHSKQCGQCGLANGHLRDSRQSCCAPSLLVMSSTSCQGANKLGCRQGGSLHKYSPKNPYKDALCLPHI